MSVGIEPNKEMLDEEIKLIRTFTTSFVEKAKEINSFNTSKLNDLKKLLEENLQPFSRIETLILLNQGEVLSLKEKKDLGFNTRLKIRSKLIEYLDLENVNKEKPFDFIKELDFFSRARAWSERDINRAKKFNKASLNLTVIEESCPDSKKHEGKYSINNAPLLPLLTCGKKCLCMYLVETSW